MNFSNLIINWYYLNKRDLPWRNTTNPYKIWLSEIILQQTQVKQGLPYYESFTKAFPTVELLAKAEEDDVLKLWQGLGYYSRARNLHFAAKQIIEWGGFPNQYDSILKLKGVGEYTAAAISSFAFKLPHAVVDGNVFRLLSRFYGIDIPINSSKGKSHFFKLANTILDKTQPDTHNQAIMEFGSQVCKAKKPNCEICVLCENCVALNTNSINNYPVKIKKNSIKCIYFDYFFFKYKDLTFVKKRTQNGIWKNLFEFPLIENEKQISEEEIIESIQFKEWSHKLKFEVNSVHSFKHILSHRVIYARFWEIDCSAEIQNEHFQRIKIEDINRLAVSRLTEKYLKRLVQPI